MSVAGCSKKFSTYGVKKVFFCWFFVCGITQEIARLIELASSKFCFHSLPCQKSLFKTVFKTVTNESMKNVSFV